MHKLPADLRTALSANSTALAAWKDITPLARNEFICWVEDAKQEATRERRIRRTQQELEEGQRRPCCWPGASTENGRAGKRLRRLAEVGQRVCQSPVDADLIRCHGDHHGGGHQMHNRVSDTDRGPQVHVGSDGSSDDDNNNEPHFPQSISAAVFGPQPLSAPDY